MIADLGAGPWLTADRMRGYCTLLLVADALVLAGTVVARHGLPESGLPEPGLLEPGLLEAGGQPSGTDFSQVWVAGRSVLAGHAAAPFDPVLHAQAQAAAGGCAAGGCGAAVGGAADHAV